MLISRHTSKLLRQKGVRWLSSEVPIGQVAAIYKMNVGGEENAVAMDAFVREQNAALEGVPGYVKAVRSVCKAEWAYEAYFVFDSLHSFKEYKASPLQTKIARAKAPALSAMGLSMDDVYMGARVYDDVM